MPSLEHGFKRAVVEFAASLALGVLFNVLLGGLGALIFLLLSLSSLAEGVENMRYWSTSYLLGYLIAQALIMRTMPDQLTFVSIVVGMTVLFYRMFRASLE